MALPEPAQAYWLQQQRIKASVVGVALRAWQNTHGIPARWQQTLPLVLATIERGQTAAVAAAGGYVTDVLADLSTPKAPIAAVDPAPLVGVFGSGYPIESVYAALPEQYAMHAARFAQIEGAEDDVVRSIAAGSTTNLAPEVTGQAMKATASQLERSVQTLLSDTGRSAESLEIAVRPGIGYVRMLNPPSCPRCVILAGKFYRWNAGFARHDRCDCRHIPAPESASGDLRVDPQRYFTSLDAAAQDKAFGKAGAQAIRDGADLNQVVNASRGMKTAQVYEKNLNITTEGVTKRGRAGKAIRARGRDPKTTPRLMPSTIYQIADDRADAMRLLQLNGFIAA